MVKIGVFSMRRYASSRPSHALFSFKKRRGEGGDDPEGSNAGVHSRGPTVPRLPPYVAAKGAALVFRRRIPSRLNRFATALRLSVALRTRDPREAGRRAAMLNALAEVAWAMEIPDDDVRNILKAFATAINGLPALPGVVAWKRLK